MKLITNKRTRAAVCPTALLSLIAGSSAMADGTGSAAGMFQGWTPIADVRLRYEDVGQVPIAEDAEALTLRARLGFQTAKLWDTALLAEGNFLVPIDDRYRPDNAVATPAQYPVVADPRDHELNRLELLNKSLPETTVAFGRQRIQLDDQRFIGNVGWRQDEQTFDAVRVVNTSLTGLTVDIAYMNRVHRVYDDESPQGTYRGGMTLANVAYQTPVGKLSGFAYLLSFDPLTYFPGLKPAAAAVLNPALSSTSTYGGRFVGDHALGVVTLGYVLSYATQAQRGDNPHMFTNDYYLGELSGAVGRLKLTAGDEVMQGNGTVGFATPLATTHLFDGWADKFLTTPVNGLENRYMSLAYQSQPLGPLQNVTGKTIFRSFASEHTSENYGSEWDFQLSAKWQRFTPAVMFADYRAGASTPISVARDTKKLFVQVDFSL